MDEKTTAVSLLITNGNIKFSKNESRRFIFTEPGLFSPNGP